MKKFKLILSMAVIAFGVSLTACGGSNSEETAKQAEKTEAAVKECETIGNELIEALKSGDETKFNELSEKLDSIYGTIDLAIITPEQKKAIDEIYDKVNAELATAAETTEIPDEPTTEK